MNKKEKQGKHLPGLTQREALALIEFVPEADILDLFGIHRTTLKRWRSGKLTMPIAARRLAWLVYGFQCIPQNEDWIGFAFGEDSLLYAPDLRHGFSSGHIRASTFMHALLRCDRQLQERLDRMTVERNFYKDQLVLESKYGLALLRAFHPF